MASENVKIKIQEVDTTQPLGAGTSSDIVFVPGFSSKFDAVKDTPVLCNTVAEFEKHFGKTPKYLTENDVEGFTDYGYRTGDYDRSYIYAKELLNQGMSVIYANIDGRDTSDIKLESCQMTPASSAVTEIKGLTVSPDAEKPEVINIDTDDTSKNNIKDSFIITGMHTIKVEGTTTNTPRKTFFEYTPELVVYNPANETSLHVSEFVVDTNFENTSMIKRVTTSNNVIGFENSGKDPSDVIVNFSVTIVPDNFGSGLVGAHAELTLKQFTGSIINSLYTKLSEVLDMIADRSEYSVKYITSGGYAATVKSEDGSEASDRLGEVLIDCAEKRGDAIALVDYMMDAEDSLFSIGKDSNQAYASIYAKMQNCYSNLGAKASYGAAFYPWGIYSCSNTLITIDPENMNVLMPASFGYMMCLATAIKTSPNWLAMAGVTRGLVPNLKTLYTSSALTNVIAEEYQPRFGTDDHTLSINAITNVRPYGLTLWGNRTLLPVDPKGTKALNFLNIRNMVSDIKKVLYTTAKSLMFEQDSDTLWLRFKSGVTPLLNQLVGGNGISDYKIIRTNTKYNGDPLTRGEMAATIKIFPLYAIEYFELTVQISDQDVTVE